MPLLLARPASIIKILCVLEVDNLSPWQYLKGGNPFRVFLDGDFEALGKPEELLGGSAKHAADTLARRVMMKCPEIIIVVAMTREKVIGRAGLLPWHLPEDLKLFRELTTGQTVIMGRETFASIGRPLPDRRNLVVSRTLPAIAGAEVCRSFAEALNKAASDDKKIFVIGGREIYCQALPFADALVVSWIREDFTGDAFFPGFDLESWSVERIEEHAAFTRVWYRKRKPATDCCIARGE